MKKVRKSMLDKLASVSKFASVNAERTESTAESEKVTNSTAPGEYLLWVRQC